MEILDKHQFLRFHSYYFHKISIFLDSRVMLVQKIIKQVPTYLNIWYQCKKAMKLTKKYYEIVLSPMHGGGVGGHQYIPLPNFHLFLCHFRPKPLSNFPYSQYLVGSKSFPKNGDYLLKNIIGVIGLPCCIRWWWTSTAIPNSIQIKTLQGSWS